MYIIVTCNIKHLQVKIQVPTSVIRCIVLKELNSYIKLNIYNLPNVLKALIDR